MPESVRYRGNDGHIHPRTLHSCVCHARYNRFQLAQIFGTGTVVFRFRKANWRAFCFAQESGYSIFYGIFLADNDTGEGIFGFGNKEIIVIVAAYI